MIEVLTNITMRSGGGKVAVMYFADGTDPLAAYTAVYNFWDEVRLRCAQGIVFDVQAAGREMDEVTGQVTGFYSVVGLGTMQGTLPNEPLADATQGLVQWRTGVVIDGREVRGRTFIPGLTVADLDAGNFRATGRQSVLLPALELANTTSGFGVWHRPRTGSPGAHIIAPSATIWSEFAVLRRRRG